MLCYTVQSLLFNSYYGMPCYAMLCYAMLCYAMLCYAMLCYAPPCYLMLYYALLDLFIAWLLLLYHVLRGYIHIYIYVHTHIPRFKMHQRAAVGSPRLIQAEHFVEDFKLTTCRAKSCPNHKNGAMLLLTIEILHHPMSAYMYYTTRRPMVLV